MCDEIVRFTSGSVIWVGGGEGRRECVLIYQISCDWGCDDRLGWKANHQARESDFFGRQKRSQIVWSKKTCLTNRKLFFCKQRQKTSLQTWEKANVPEMCPKCARNVPEMCPTQCVAGRKRKKAFLAPRCAHFDCRLKWRNERTAKRQDGRQASWKANKSERSRKSNR